MKYIFVNPAAKGGGAKEKWESRSDSVRAALGGGNICVEWTREEDRGVGQVREALRRGCETMVWVGGDGTFSHLVNGLYENDQLISPKTRLSLLPAGRGNDFLRSLSGHAVPPSWEQCLSWVRDGKVRYLDIGKVQWKTETGEESENLFINVASVGFPGWVVNRVLSGKGILSHPWVSKTGATYFLQTLASLNEYRSPQFILSLDGQEVHRGPLHFAFIMNGFFNGGGMRWSQSARLDDGLFHLLLLERFRYGKIPLLLSKMKSGDWRGLPEAKTWVGKVIEVRGEGEGDFDRLFETDGDQPQPAGTRWARFSLLKDQVTLLAP